MTSMTGATGSDLGGVVSTGPSPSTTTYFVTFEEPSGERLELMVTGREFGQLAEGDR